MLPTSFYFILSRYVRDMVEQLDLVFFLSTHKVPKPKMTKRDQSTPHLIELLANDRQSQAGHMLLNLNTDPCSLIREVYMIFVDMCVPSVRVRYKVCAADVYHAP